MLVAGQNEVDARQLAPPDRRPGHPDVGPVGRGVFLVSGARTDRGRPRSSRPRLDQEAALPSHQTASAPRRGGSDLGQQVATGSDRFDQRHGFLRLEGVRDAIIPGPESRWKSGGLLQSRGPRRTMLVKGRLAHGDDPSVPRRRQVEYPISDGKPMAESGAPCRLMMALMEALEQYFEGDPKVYVGGTSSFATTRATEASTRADVYVARGIPKLPHGTITCSGRKASPPTLSSS